jgi:RNA polymerase sigma factor (sigma-70 family)
MHSTDTPPTRRSSDRTAELVEWLIQEATRRNYTGLSRDDIRDAVTELFMRHRDNLADRLDRYSDPVAIVFTTAKAIRHSEARTEQRRRRILEQRCHDQRLTVTAPRSASHIDDNIAAQQQLRPILTQLSPADRDILNDLANDIPTSETSQRLGLPEGTIRQQRSRALQRAQRHTL